MTAAVVIAGVQLVGWPTEAPRPIAEINTGAIEALSSRLNDLEGRESKPAAPDPAQAARLDALENRWLRCAPISRAPVRVRTSFQANSMP